MKFYMKNMLLASTIILGATFASAETTLKLAHAAPESDLQQSMSLFFKEQVESLAQTAMSSSTCSHLANWAMTRR